jgi:hypothetical protein
VLLKEGMTFMFEMEIIFASLIVATDAAIFFAIYDDALVADFTAVNLGSWEFWINLLGMLTADDTIIFSFCGISIHCPYQSAAHRCS